MAVKEVIEIEARTGKAQQNVENLNEGIQDTTESAEDFGKVSSGVMGRLDKLTGGLITSLKGVVRGLRATIGSMGVLKTAIIATGVGALVVAFGSLVAFFTKTQRGADKISQVFKGLGAIVDVLIDRVSSFGEGLFKIVSGDFEEGFNILKASISGVGDEIQKEGAAAVQLEKDMQALQDREIEFIKVQAEKRRAIEQARLAAEDESLSDKERAEALREGIRIQNELTEEQIAIEKERARIIRERVALGESTRDDIRQQAEAEARVIELETERDRRLRSIQTRLNAFTKSTKELTKEKDKEAKATETQSKKQEELNKKREKELELLLEKNRLSDLQQQISILQQVENIENEYFNRRLEREDVEKNAIRDKYFTLIETARQAGQDTTILEQARQEELSAIEDKYAGIRIAREEAVEQAKLNIVANALSAATGLAEKGSDTYKALAVAQVLLDTFRGVQAAFASNAANVGATTLTGGAWPFIQAAAAASFGAANIAGILAVDPKGSSASVPSISRPQGGAVAANTSAPQFNIVQAQQQTRLLSDISGAVGQPARAYVVSSDVSTAQALERKRIKNASF